MTKITVLLVCLTLLINFGNAKTIPEKEQIQEEWDSNDKGLNVNKSNIPLEVSQKFADDDNQFGRLHIHDQLQLDKHNEEIEYPFIYGNSDENKPGIHAYGLPKKNIDASGFIERTSLSEGKEPETARSSRLIEAYGKRKENLDNNGEIERLLVPPVMRTEKPTNTERRIPRSIETVEPDNNVDDTSDDNNESDDSLEDLETQDSKVFRPLFVYRKQVANRQKRNRCLGQNNGEYAQHRCNRPVPSY